MSAYILNNWLLEMNTTSAHILLIGIIVVIASIILFKSKYVTAPSQINKPAFYIALLVVLISSGLFALKKLMQ